MNNPPQSPQNQEQHEAHYLRSIGLTWGEAFCPNPNCRERWCTRYPQSLFGLPFKIICPSCSNNQAHIV